MIQPSLFTEDRSIRVQHLWDTTTEEVVEYQQAYAQAKADGTLAQFQQIRSYQALWS